MAKKRKEGTEEEELDFKFPTFDEEAYLKRERRNIKTMFISFLFGLLLAVISFGFWSMISKDLPRFELVLLVGVVYAFSFKYIFLRLHIDLTGFGKKGWATTYATYFFTWLLTFIVLVNPPFFDDEPPHMEIAVLPAVQEMGGTVKIVALIIDNVGVNKEGINFNMVYPDGTNHTPEFTFENSIFQYTYDTPNPLMGTYNYTMNVKDVNGRAIPPITGSFKYNTACLQITSSINPNIKSGDPIVIHADEKISTDNFLVYYTIDNGTAINVNRKETTGKSEYETSPKYQGWTSDENQTVRVYAQVSHYFINVREAFNNTIEDTSVYNFSTGDDSSIGAVQPLAITDLNYRLPQLRLISGTPGFDLAIVLVAVIVVGIFFKRRKKDNTT